MLTVKVLVTGQLDTSVCNHVTLLRSNSDGLESVEVVVVVSEVEMAVVSEVEVVVVSEVEVVVVSEVEVAVVSEVEVVVVVLVSATPDEDLLDEHSKGQHHMSEQPLSDNTTAKSTPKRSIITIRFGSQTLQL